MAELMANPRVMQRVQSETRSVLTGQSLVQESALKDMHYLRAVIRETLRMHPPTPFFTRVCLQDCKIHEYNLPEGATVLTNVWAISRDPKYWDEPEKFKPERFESEKIDVDFRGLDFEFTPFGVGRRMCPGTGFAHANIEIALASLLYHFDWELPTGVELEKVDMTEVFGATLSRKADLFLHPIPHVSC
jgi:cytochrome P450